MARAQIIPPSIKYIQDLFAHEDAELLGVRKSAPSHLLVMQIAPDEGKLLYTLLKLIKAKYVLEIGTFVGYSALWMARALPKDGKLISVERSEEHFAIAAKNFQKSSQANKVELICSDAKEYIKNLDEKVKFDAVFIDADKAGYPIYLELITKHLNPGSMVMADNTFLWGSVYDEAIKSDPEMKIAMQKFNVEISDPEKFDSIMIPTEEGLVVAVRK